MHSLKTKGLSRVSHIALVAFLTVSFWSSGVVLIRILDTYNVWGGGVILDTLFFLTVPLVLISIIGVKKMLSAIRVEDDSILYKTTVYVILMHALALITYPRLYGFDPSPSLGAVAWLLWFGALVMFVIYDQPAFKRK